MKKLVLEQVEVQDYNPVTKEMDHSTKYVVMKVVNAIDPLIGTKLHKDIVHAYCEDVDWTVEIKPRGK